MKKIELSDCDLKVISDICAKYEKKESELINILHKIQSHFGYLPEEVQRAVASELDIPVARVYGVVTFYSFFTMQPKGKYAVSVCLGTACYVRGAEAVVAALEKELGIKVGGVTDDGLFSLDCLRCVGACGLAPVMMVGEKVYGRVTPEQVGHILDEYRRNS